MELLRRKSDLVSLYNAKGDEWDALKDMYGSQLKVADTPKPQSNIVHSVSYSGDDPAMKEYARNVDHNFRVSSDIVTSRSGTL